MAIDAYMFFQKYDGTYVTSESQVDMDNIVTGDQIAPLFQAANKSNGLFEVQDYGFGTEQVYNLSSQSKGLGAGKITFQDFTINRKIDISSPQMYQFSCNGTAFKTVMLGLRKSAGDDKAGLFFLAFEFKMVGVKTIAYSHDDESPKEAMSLVYGALCMKYVQQKNDGSKGGESGYGWNQQKNVMWGWNADLAA
jgi:type VI secretion system secreted protein Hcp